MTTREFSMIASSTLDGMNTILFHNPMGIVNTDYCYTHTRLYYPSTRDEEIWWDQVWNLVIDAWIDLMTISVSSNRVDNLTDSGGVYRRIFAHQ